MHIVEKHACFMNIDQILNNRRIHEGNFAVAATKICANCKLCGSFWPLSHYIQKNALQRQAAHFMHIVEKHACLMNIDQILNNRRIHEGSFAATATKICKLQTVWTFLAT